MSDTLEKDMKGEESTTGEDEKFLGVSLTPSGTSNFPVLISKNYENETTLNEVFVVFESGGKKILGKLVAPETYNPYIHKQSGHALFDYLKRFGEYKGLEEPDSRLATCEIIGIKGETARLVNLQSSPGSQIHLKLAKEDDLNYFFGSSSTDTIGFTTIRGTDYILPIPPEKFFFHVDITAPTGHGKTYMGALQAISLNGRLMKVKNRRGEEEIRRIKVWFLDVTGQVAEDDYGLFKKLPQDPRLVISLQDVQIETSEELVAALDNTYNFARLPFKAKISDVTFWLRLYLKDRKQWNYWGFQQAVREAIRSSYRSKETADKTVVDTMQVLSLIGGERLWTQNVEPRLKAPYNIDDLNILAEQGKMIVFDLKEAEEVEKPIFTDVLLKKLYDKALAEYHGKRVEYGFSTIVFIDEAQDDCPEVRDKQWFNEDCRKTIINIAKKGRKFGLGLVLMTQRYANVAKDALTQMNTHFTGKVLYGDRKSITINQGITTDDLEALREHEFFLTGYGCPVSKIIVRGVRPDDVRRVV